MLSDFCFGFFCWVNNDDVWMIPLDDLFSFRFRFRYWNCSTRRISCYAKVFELYVLISSEWIECELNDFFFIWRVKFNAFVKLLIFRRFGVFTQLVEFRKMDSVFVIPSFHFGLPCFFLVQAASFLLKITSWINFFKPNNSMIVVQPNANHLAQQLLDISMCVFIMCLWCTDVLFHAHKDQLLKKTSCLNSRKKKSFFSLPYIFTLQRDNYCVAWNQLVWKEKTLRGCCMWTIFEKINSTF